MPGTDERAHGSVRRAEWKIEENRKWSVPGLVGQTKSGNAENHATGVKAAQRLGCVKKSKEQSTGKCVTEVVTRSHHSVITW
jgi:hypothetical protein